MSSSPEQSGETQGTIRLEGAGPTSGNEGWVPFALATLPHARLTQFVALKSWYLEKGR